MVKMAIFVYEYWQVGSGLEIVEGRITLSSYYFWENYFKYLKYRVSGMYRKFISCHVLLL
ncbi:hypothetical protein F383_14370 [Gossypium arboreum]|uniref:Uncharacterized protein n=1 Tax=Gossypium arboreum TaxID=29729 RepID=A0A0B0NJW1_GOSAR|nr:hypothetical protein F383_14370 [Gossypium arboreum]